MNKLDLFSIICLIIICILFIKNLNFLKLTSEDFKNLNLNESDKKIKLHDVFMFLGKIGLPPEINMSYATTILAKNPLEQAKLNDFLKAIKKNKLVISKDNIEYIKNTLDIELQPIGLINSLNTLRAHVHALKIFERYNQFNYQVINEMRK